MRPSPRGLSFFYCSSPRVFSQRQTSGEFHGTFRRASLVVVVVSRSLNYLKRRRRRACLRRQKYKEKLRPHTCSLHARGNSSGRRNPRTLTINLLFCVTPRCTVAAIANFVATNPARVNKRGRRYAEPLPSRV